nr:hypothetical protein CFP56_03087 [Quercus suber]
MGDVLDGRTRTIPPDAWKQRFSMDSMISVYRSYDIVGPSRYPVEPAASLPHAALRKIRVNAVTCSSHSLCSVQFEIIKGKQQQIAYASDPWFIRVSKTRTLQGVGLFVPNMNTQSSGFDSRTISKKLYDLYAENA